MRYPVLVFLAIFLALALFSPLGLLAKLLVSIVLFLLAGAVWKTT